MKIKDTFEIKNKLTAAEYLDFVDALFESYFSKNEDNEIIEYRPDYATIMENAIVTAHCTNAIETEKNEDIIINIDLVDDISENDTLLSMIELVKDSPYFKKAKRDVIYRVEHLKELIVHRSNSNIEDIIISNLELESKKLEVELKANEAAEILIKEQTKQAEYSNKIAEYISPNEQAEITKKMNESNFDMEKLSELIAEKYFESEKRENKLSEIVDSKNAEIVELKKYKNAIEARNVLEGK